LAIDLNLMLKINFLSHNWLAQKINNGSFEHFSPLIKGRTIDLGCGSSPFKEDILKLADEYIGVDWGNTQHDKTNVNITADLTQKFPFENHYADTLLSFQTLEHLTEPDFFLSECSRILKPGGTLIITVPFMWHVHEAPYDFFRYTRHGLEYLLKKNGFTKIKIQETTGFWQMLVLKFNYHTARYARGPLKLFFIPLWWIGQTLSPHIDKFDMNTQETASYFTVANKP
jgi:SAM-dependent methyltransferase